MGKCVNPLKDLNFLKENKLVEITIGDSGIDYEICNDGTGKTTGVTIRKFAKTKEELEEMNKGALYRELRGTGIGFEHINGGNVNEVFVLQCASSQRESTDDYFHDIHIAWTESFRTLREACDADIDIPHLVWGGTDTAGFAFYDCVGAEDEQFDGMDNEDIATYLVTSDDKLQLSFVIRHQCLIPKNELIEAVLKFYKTSRIEYVPVSERDDLIASALAMRERGVKVNDLRDKED